MMKVLLDTNVVVVSISRRSRFHPIWQAIGNGAFELLVTEDILLEYEEIIGRLMGGDVAEKTLSGLELLPNLVLVNRYYIWHLIENEPDDNKFVDCAIAGGADFIVTNDAHFKVPKEVPFPKVNTVSPDDFLSIVMALE